MGRAPSPVPAHSECSVGDRSLFFAVVLVFKRLLILHNCPWEGQKEGMDKKAIERVGPC